MTITGCPHGCGGMVDTARDEWCPSCGRGLTDTEVTVPESATANIGMVGRKTSWCWRWHGPAHHRMRCRLKSGHDGECWDHEERPDFDTAIVSVSGALISVTLADEPPATALIERICDEYDGAFRALADEPPKEES